MEKTQKSRPISQGHQRRKSSVYAATPSFLLLLCLGILTFGVYGNVVNHGFVYDDLATLVTNQHLQSWNGDLSFLFQPTYFEQSGENSYRPMVTLFNYVVYAVFGLNARMYHLLSVVMHLLTGFLVYAVGVEICRKRLTAFAAASLFLVHPALTEAVNGISYNEDLLTTIFSLLALWVYLRWHWRGLWLAWGLFLLALFAKEMAITLPLLIILTDWVVSNPPQTLLATLKQRKWSYLGWLLVALLYILIRFVVMRNSAGVAASSYGPLATRMLYLPNNLGRLLSILLIPLWLNADYTFSYPAHFFETGNLQTWLLVIGLIGLSVKLWNYDRRSFLGIWWMMLTLLPVLNLLEITNPIAERYLYLPAFGFCLTVALAFRLEQPASGMWWMRFGGLCGLLILYASLTIARNPVWQDDEHLWRVTLFRSPHSVRANNNLGVIYKQQGRFTEAIQCFERALAQQPGYAPAYCNLGNLYLQAGQWNEAIQAYVCALSLTPQDDEAYYGLGLAYLQEGRVSDAIAAFLQMVELRPDKAEAALRIGNLFRMSDRFAEAISFYQRALELNPQEPVVYYNLGLAYYAQDQLQAACSAWEQALRLDPSDIVIQRQRGQLCGQ